MYKKITHNITEEHFAHPIAAELKKKIDKTIVSPTPKTKLPAKTSSETALYLASHELFGKLYAGVRDYLVAALEGAPDTEYITKQLLSDINKFGPVIAGYYSTQVGDEVALHLTEFAKTFTELVTAAKMGKDYAKLTTISLSHLDNLARVLGRINPAHWPEATVKEYLYEYASYVLEQVKSRVRRDWESDRIAKENSSKVLMSGPITTGKLSGKQDLANVFASGLISQFPALFTS